MFKIASMCVPWSRFCILSRQREFYFFDAVSSRQSWFTLQVMKHFALSYGTKQMKLKDRYTECEAVHTDRLWVQTIIQYSTIHYWACCGIFTQFEDNLYLRSLLKLVDGSQSTSKTYISYFTRIYSVRSNLNDKWNLFQDSPSSFWMACQGVNSWPPPSCWSSCKSFWAWLRSLISFLYFLANLRYSGPRLSYSCIFSVSCIKFATINLQKVVHKGLEKTAKMRETAWSTRAFKRNKSSFLVLASPISSRLAGFDSSMTFVLRSHLHDFIVGFLLGHAQMVVYFLQGFHGFRIVCVCQHSGLGDICSQQRELGLSLGLSNFQDVLLLLNTSLVKWVQAVPKPKKYFPCKIAEDTMNEPQGTFHYIIIQKAQTRPVRESNPGPMRDRHVS